MAEAATVAAAAAAALPNHGGGSNPGSGTSTPGSRFKVDATDSRKNSSGSTGLAMGRALSLSLACVVSASLGVPQVHFCFWGACDKFRTRLASSKKI